MTGAAALGIRAAGSGGVNPAATGAAIAPRSRSILASALALAVVIDCGSCGRAVGNGTVVRAPGAVLAVDEEFDFGDAAALAVPALFAADLASFFDASFFDVVLVSVFAVPAVFWTGALCAGQPTAIAPATASKTVMLWRRELNIKSGFPRQPESCSGDYTYSLDQIDETLMVRKHGKVWSRLRNFSGDAAGWQHTGRIFA